VAINALFLCKFKFIAGVTGLAFEGHIVIVDAMSHQAKASDAIVIEWVTFQLSGCPAIFVVAYNAVRTEQTSMYLRFSMAAFALLRGAAELSTTVTAFTGNLGVGSGKFKGQSVILDGEASYGIKPVMAVETYLAERFRVKPHEVGLSSFMTFDADRGKNGELLITYVTVGTQDARASIILPMSDQAKCRHCVVEMSQRRSHQIVFRTEMIRVAAPTFVGRFDLTVKTQADLPLLGYGFVALLTASRFNTFERRVTFATVVAEISM
jgi:hypothetical protein